MKKSNRLSVRVLALLMTFVMVFSLGTTVFAANTEITSTEYYTISYNSDADVPEVVVSLNAEAFGELLAERNFTKEELKKFLPEFVAEILETRSMPSIGELVDFFPEEMLNKSELAKIIPADLLEKYFTTDLIEKILPKSEWANVLPVKDVINAEEIEYIMDNYPNVVKSLLTADVIKSLMTDDVLDALLTPEVVDALVTEEIIKKLATPEVIKALMTKEVVNALATPDVVKQLMTQDVVDALVTADVLTSLMTPEIMNELVDPTLAASLMTQEVIDALVSSDVLVSLMTPEVVNQLATPEVVQSLFTADVMNALVSEDDLMGLVDNVVLQKLVSGYNFAIKFAQNQPKVEALIAAGVLSYDDLYNCLSDAQKSQISDHLSDERKLMKVLNFFSGTNTKLRGLLRERYQGIVAVLGADTIVEWNGTINVVNAIGKDQVITAIGGAEAVINHVGPAKVLEAVGSEKAIEVITIDTIVAKIGIENIVNEVGAATILDKVGFDKVIEKVGMDNIIDKVGVDAILAEVGTDRIIEVVGTDKIISTVGPDAIIEEIGMDNIINEIGLDAIIDEVGTDKIISTVGMDAILNKVGMDNVINSVMANTDADYINRLIQKVLESPNFDFNKVLSAVDKSVIKEELKNIFIKVFMNDIDSIDLLYHDGVDTSANIFAFNATDVKMELKLQAMSDAVLASVPDTSDLMSVEDGSTFYMIGLGMTFANNANAYGFKVRVTLDGNTDTLKAYAEKLATVLTYSANAGLTVDVTDFDENAFISFADVLRKALATDRLTDAEKAKLFTIFTKEGQDLLDALEAFDFDVEWIDDKYVPYLEQIRDKMLTVLERVVDSSSVNYRNFTLASCYDDLFLTFDLNDSVSVPTAKLIQKLCEKVGFSISDFNSIFGSYEEYVSYNLDFTFGMDEVYRVRYFDANDNLVYTTFLPMGTNLSVINNNTSELSGKAGIYGWADADGNIVTVTPDYAHLDLYPANELNVDEETYTATFVADGKIVDKVVFKEGDTKLSREPKVPEKIGYHGRWENYKLADKDITIKAIYTAKTYTVIYDANGGEGTMANQILSYDKADTLKACGFTREGHTFLGWNTKADGSGVFYADQQVVKNMTIVDGIVLYAQWQVKAPNVHTVTFMANGVVVDKVTFNEGDKELSRVPEVPTRTGYTGAWEGYVLANTDITVNAVYTANEYTVVFNANGGAGSMPNQTMTYDTFANLCANTYAYAGHTFAGWNTQADGTGTSYADGENVKNLAESGEVTLYAQWNEEVTNTTESTEGTTTTAPVEQDGGFNWLVLVIVLAVLAVGGGVAGFLVYNKKKSV